MSTLGNAKRPPWPGTVDGTIDDAIAEQDAALEALQDAAWTYDAIDPDILRQSVREIQRFLDEVDARRGLSHG